MAEGQGCDLPDLTLAQMQSVHAAFRRCIRCAGRAKFGRLAHVLRRHSARAGARADRALEGDLVMRSLRLLYLRPACVPAVPMGHQSGRHAQQPASADQAADTTGADSHATYISGIGHLGRHSPDVLFL